MSRTNDKPARKATPEKTIPSAPKPVQVALVSNGGRPRAFPLRVFIDGNMPAVPLIHDLTSVGLKLGSDAKGNWWLTRKVRHG